MRQLLRRAATPLEHAKHDRAGADVALSGPENLQLAASDSNHLSLAIEEAMSNDTYTVRARWDEESRSWWTDGEDIPGLCCQAASFDELVETILALAPDLLRDNGIGAPGLSVDIAVTAERHGTAKFAS